ncbi:hypothetical protein ZWY2020_024953 [Hordeum vulgare]|nr:hypothetical protein ZWY2020_024953 [Hordeum vulgare]
MRDRCERGAVGVITRLSVTRPSRSRRGRRGREHDASRVSWRRGGAADARGRRGGRTWRGKLCCTRSRRGGDVSRRRGSCTRQPVTTPWIWDAAAHQGPFVPNLGSAGPLCTGCEVVLGRAGEEWHHRLVALHPSGLWQARRAVAGDGVSVWWPTGDE